MWTKWDEFKYRLYIWTHFPQNVQHLTGTEWSENWDSWPHCNGQAGCWMHVSAAWCRCTCFWCRIARWVRRK